MTGSAEKWGEGGLGGFARWANALVGCCLVMGATGCVTHPSRAPGGDSLVETEKGVVFYHSPMREVRTRDKFNPIWWFKNDDDPVPPDSYRPENRCRTTLWHFRNPMHNFMFYVIGITDKEFSRVGRFPSRVGNPDGGWNYAVCRRRCARLPFLSYSGSRLNCYFGWRERGNFGIKINIARKKKEGG